MKQLYARATGPFAKFLLTAFSLVYINATRAQQVSGIVTDFNGFWKSSVLSPNPVKPTNSHNLLAFTYNGVQYSTGANDPLLNSRGETFVAGDFWALPVDGFTGTINSNTKMGWGEMKDGVHNGPGVAVKPTVNIPLYLTDGIKGLDLGTCVANIPSGSLFFSVSNIKPQHIGDGIPDILVTQIADPSGSTDRYSFINASGNIVGTRKDILFTSIVPVGTWTADFYEPQGTGNLTTLTTTFTNTDRPLRLWAADLSDLGITVANYQSITKFKIELSGNSDVAFVGYNNRTMSIASILPVNLSNFTAKNNDNSVLLNWTTLTENNTQSFIVERSGDDNQFEAIGEVAANGNSTTALHYTHTDKKPLKGTNYYRLKTLDRDGSYQYSQVVKVQMNSTANALNIYPNPATSATITITHPVSRQGSVSIYAANGVLVWQQAVINTWQTKADVAAWQKGIYYAVWQDGKEKIILSFAKQ